MKQLDQIERRLYLLCDPQEQELAREEEKLRKQQRLREQDMQAEIKVLSALHDRANLWLAKRTR